MENLAIYITDNINIASLNGSSTSSSSSILRDALLSTIDSFVNTCKKQHEYVDVEVFRTYKHKEFMLDCIISDTKKLVQFSNKIKTNIYWGIEHEWNPDNYDDYFTHDFIKLIHFFSKYKLAVFVTSTDNQEERIGFASQILNLCNSVNSINNFFLVEINRNEIDYIPPSGWKKKYANLDINCYLYKDNIISLIYERNIF